MSRIIDSVFNKWSHNLISKLHNLNTFFIEINSTCNLNCKHCYIPQGCKDKELPLEKIEEVLKQIKEEWGTSVGIALTGGEPLLHKSFWKIAEYLKKEGFRWSLATNGILFNEESIKKLKNLKCGAITISIDGDYETHTKQRGEKSQLDHVINNIKLLVSEGLQSIYITSTIHDDNVKSLKFLSDLVLKFDQKVKWRINPLLHCENAVQNNLKISPKTYEKICKFREDFLEKNKINIMISEKNPLSLKHKEYLYSDLDYCLAGITTFGILSNGDIVNCMSCREKALGNIYNDYSLVKIWEEQNLSRKGLCEKHLESKNSLWER